MNLSRPGGNDAIGTRNRSHDIAPSSGVCSRCVENCTGNCDGFKASSRGREVIYPGPFAEITAGSDKAYPVDYSHLNIVFAMGAPYFKAACVGRALMIPGFVGDNIEGVVRGGDAGTWDKLPTSVAKYGDTPEQIFATYATLEDRYGDKVNEMPLGAIALYTFVDKLRTGLTQFMAGARSFRLDTVKRTDVVALTEEAAKVSGIPYIMDAYREEAERILDA